jgi:hypothetical protein
MSERNSSKSEIGTDEIKLPTNGTGSPPRLGTKKDVAAMIQMSPRSVDNYLAAGLPCIKLSPRRCRFDLDECAAWFKTNYGVQRIGKEQGRSRAE